MVRLFLMRVKKKKISCVVVALMILFIRVCDTSSLKNTGGRERERKWRWWWGLCCACQKSSRQESLIACPRFSETSRRRQEKVKSDIAWQLFFSFDYFHLNSLKVIFEGSSIAKSLTFLSFESPLKRSLSRFWLHIAAENNNKKWTKNSIFDSCGLFPRVEERKFSWKCWRLGRFGSAVRKDNNNLHVCVYVADVFFLSFDGGVHSRKKRRERNKETGGRSHSV